MMAPPRVSVLIPCKNGERYLAATLASALDQTLAPCEVVVVDDGSTDRSVEIAERHGPLVRVSRNPGQGASAARSHAATMATGDYFQYLDADDLLRPHALASRAAALMSTGADVAICDWERLAKVEGIWQAVKTESGELPAGASPDAAILLGFWAPPAAILYRRELCERIGPWRESLPVIQDARYLLDAARLGGVVTHVAGIGASYRQHVGGSLSTESNSRFWNDVLRNAREVEALWSETGTFDAEHRAAMASTFAMCVRVGFQNDQRLFDQARQELARFPEHVLPRLVRAAILLTRVAGYRPARLALAAFCR